MCLLRTSASAAELGEPRAELLAKHGAPQREDAQGLSYYQWSDWTLGVQFVDGVAARFEYEKTVALTNLTAAGFANCWADVPLPQRITHPKKGRYPGATFDYLFLRGGKLTGPPAIAPAWASDHQPVTVEVSPE